MQSNADICPVCGMAVSSSLYTKKHNKMYFYFCSEQCQTNFSIRPNLYMKRQPGHPQSPRIKQRTLHLAESLNSEHAALITEHLQQLMGIRHVAVNGNNLQLEYDLLQVNEVKIEQSLSKIGVKLGEGWVDRLRRAWVHELENNELDNLAAPTHPCCNRAPPGT